MGAILTQQVAWRNVSTAISNLKKAECLSPEALLTLRDEVLWDLIRPTRFYRQKGERLRSFCRMLTNDYSGDLQQLFALDIASFRARLLNIPGIGQETADSIILYAAGKPVFVIDAYTQRIMTRLGLLAAPMSYSDLQRRFMICLPSDVQLFNEYHALLDALGHHLCLKKEPRCSACPLRDICAVSFPSPEG